MNANQNSNINYVHLTGSLSVNPQLRLSRSGQPYYSGTIFCERTSLTSDDIPVVIPQHLYNDPYDHPVTVTLDGFLCAVHNKQAPRHKRLRVYVKVVSLTFEKEQDELHSNTFSLDTTVIRPFTLRHTPVGKLIAEGMVRLSATTTVPVILWNSTAKAISDVPQYARLNIKGRIQSRDFSYLDDDNNVKQSTTIELCATHFDVISLPETNKTEEQDNDR